MNLALPGRKPLARHRIDGRRWLAAAVPIVLMLLCALFIGALTGLYGNLFNQRPNLLIALPMVLALTVCFLVSRTALLMAILFTRALLDPMLATTRLGGGPGLGGVLNGLILLLVLSLAFDKHRPPFKEAARLWGPFIAMYVIGVFMSPSKGDSIRTVLSMLTYPAAFLVGARMIRRIEDFDRVTLFLVASAVAVNLYAMVGIASKEALYRVYFFAGEGARLTGGFPHPNVMAFYEVMVIAMCLYLFHGRQRVNNRLAMTMVAFVFVTALGLLVLTKTRSAWLATFVMFLLYAWFVNRKVLPLVLLIPVAAMFVPEVRDRLADLQTGNEMAGWAKLNSYAWRKLIWTSGLGSMAPSHYLTGYGIDSFVQRSIDFFPLSGGKGFGAHNVYVQLFFEVGLLGLLAMLWLMGSLLRTAWRMPRGPVRGIQLFLIVMFLIVCASDNMLHYLVFDLYLFYVLGAGWALGRLETERAIQAAAGPAPVRRRHPPPWNAVQPSRPALPHR